VELLDPCPVRRVQCAAPMFFNATAEFWFYLRSIPFGASPPPSATQNLSGRPRPPEAIKRRASPVEMTARCLSKFESIGSAPAGSAVDHSIKRDFLDME
jgi:hypothetical protein